MAKGDPSIDEEDVQQAPRNHRINGICLVHVFQLIKILHPVVNRIKLGHIEIPGWHGPLSRNPLPVADRLPILKLVMPASCVILTL